MRKFFKIIFLLLFFVNAQGSLKGEYSRETGFITDKFPVKEFIVLSGRHRVYLIKGITSSKDLTKEMNGEPVCVLAYWKAERDTIIILETRSFKLGGGPDSKCLCTEQKIIITKKYYRNKMGCLQPVYQGNRQVSFCKVKKNKKWN